MLFTKTNYPPILKKTKTVPNKRCLYCKKTKKNIQPLDTKSIKINREKLTAYLFHMIVELHH